MSIHKRMAILLLPIGLAMRETMAEGPNGPANVDLRGQLERLPKPMAVFAPDVESFALAPPNRGKLRIVQSEGTPFRQAIEVETTDPGASPWEPQLMVRMGIAARKGDALLAIFRVRNPQAAAGADAWTELVVERAGPPYDKSLEYSVACGPDWTLHYTPFAAHADYEPGQWQLLFRAGERRQIMQVADITILHFGKTVPLHLLPRVSRIYPGIEPDASWRAEAARRIEHLRKANLQVEVVDRQGRPIPGVPVRAEMMRHAFRFGTAVRLYAVAERDRPEHAEYVRHLLEYFNHVVNENDLKWPCWEQNDGKPFSKARSMEALRWLKSKGFTIKGHCLVWPSWRNTPTRLRAMENNPEALRQAIRRHMADLVGTTDPWVDEWDVINEPFDNHDLMRVLGDEAMIEWFRTARQWAPRARLYLNDYGILATGGRTDTAHQAHYEKTIRFLLDGGAPLTALGMQSHFGENPTPPETLWKILDRYAAFGLPIQITEFDVNSTDEAFQAAYLRDFMTAVFAHPAVTGFVQWGFWEGAHWRPAAALFRKDWTIKPNGQMYKKLVFDEWWTRETVTTDTRGRAVIRGFLGAYRVSALVAGRPLAAEVELPKEGAQVRLTVSTP